MKNNGFIKETNGMSFDSMYRDMPNGKIVDAVLEEEDSNLIQELGLMGLFFEEARQPMTQPVYTKPRGKSLNKPARTNGWEQNRINYQKLRDRVCKCTDSKVDLNDYEILEYAVGNKFRKHNGLGWNHFDWSSPAGKYFNPTNRQERYHFLCWRDEVCTVVNAVKIK